MLRFVRNLFLAELAGVAALVTGGLATIGSFATLQGISQHAPAVSWILVALFSVASGAFLVVAVELLRLGWNKRRERPIAVTVRTRAARAVRRQHQLR